MDNTAIKDLVEMIALEKQQFLADLKSSVKRSVERKSFNECLHVVTISMRGDRVLWTYKDGAPYFARLWAFIRSQPFEESYIKYDVESALTEPVMAIVAAEYQKLLERHNDEVANLVLSELMAKPQFRDAFANAILKSKLVGGVTGAAKHVLKDHLLAGIHDRLHDAGSSIASHSATAVAKIGATASGKIILTKVSILLAQQLGPILLKLLAKPAVLVMFKKIVAVAVLGAVAKFVLAKLGGVPFGPVVWVAIAAWIAYDISNFPRKLGENIGQSLSDNMETEFSKTTYQLLTELVVEFTAEPMIKGLAEGILADTAATTEIKNIFAAA
jgi:hypothetical protein